MAHVAKYTAGAIGHMLTHYDRTKNGLGSHIDLEKTHLNFNLAADEQPMNQLDFIHKRLSQVRVQHRKDVNVLVDWVVTAPRDLPHNLEKDFFKATYKFLSARYGAENVVSSYVHYDEQSPHMHFAFVPVTWDARKNRYKLSAKEVITRSDLRTFHQELSEYVEHDLGLPVSILNDATKDGNKSIAELKRKSASEHLEAALSEASKIVSVAQEKVTGIDAEYNAKKAYVKACERDSDVSALYPAYAKKKKNLFSGDMVVTVPKKKWEQRCIASGERFRIDQAEMTLEDAISKFKMTTSGHRIDELEAEVQELKFENKQLRRDNNQLSENLSSIQKYVEYRTEHKLKKILAKCSPETRTEFLNQAQKSEAEAEIKKQHSREI